LGVPPPRSGPGKSDSPSAEAQFDEFYLTSPERIHFAKALANRRSIVVLSARRSATVALAWAQLRAALGTIEAAFAQTAAKVDASDPSPLPAAGPPPAAGGVASGARVDGSVVPIPVTHALSR
jgi:hypothetical protein